MKHWKASEWRNWILFYAVPCLEGIIRSCDLNHLTLLSRATFILNKDSINSRELNEAELLLQQYVENFQETFGIINMKFNIHLLNHLVDTVRNWGPFWAHSAFPFEAWNRKIVEKVTSANSRPLQIATRYLMIRFIHGFIGDPAIPKQTIGKIRAILSKGSKKQLMSDFISDEPCVFKSIGNVENRAPCSWENRALRSAGFNPEVATYYERVVIQNIVYRRREKNNKQETRFCDKYVYCQNIPGFAEILNIIHFHHHDELVHGVFVRCLSSVGNAFGATHIENIEFSSRRMFINAQKNLLVPAMIITTPKNFRAAAIPNVWETD